MFESLSYIALLQASLLATSSSLPTRLAEPLASTSQLLDLLVPPLSALDALPDHRDLASRHGEADGSIDASRFVKRQLGLVQKVLVERVWPDWEGALEADEGRAALAVFERFFLPASTIASSNAATNLANDIALSAYAVLSSLLSVKSAATLRPRSLEIIASLLVRLSAAFSVRQLYRATFCAADPASSGAAVDDEDEVDPASLSRWEHGLKDLLAVPTRVANAWGSSKEKHRLGQLPAALEERCGFFRSILRLRLTRGRAVHTRQL